MRRQPLRLLRCQRAPFGMSALGTKMVLGVWICIIYMYIYIYVICNYIYICICVYLYIYTCIIWKICGTYNGKIYGKSMAMMMMMILIFVWAEMSW